MVLDNLLGLVAEAESDAEAYEVAARQAVRALVAPQGRVDAKRLEREHTALPGLRPTSRRCARCGAGPRRGRSPVQRASSNC